MYRSAPSAFIFLGGEGGGVGVCLFQLSYKQIDSFIFRSFLDLVNYSRGGLSVILHCGVQGNELIDKLTSVVHTS